jgi:hypothetical protein
MTYITTDEVKDQLSIELDNTSHDTRITRLIAAAELWAAHFLDAPLSDYEDSPVTSPPTLPEDLKSALLIHCEIEFDRDERNMDKLMQTCERLLWPYRISNLGV